MLIGEPCSCEGKVGAGTPSPLPSAGLRGNPKEPSLTETVAQVNRRRSAETTNTAGSPRPPLLKDRFAADSQRKGVTQTKLAFQRVACPRAKEGRGWLH